MSVCAYAIHVPILKKMKQQLPIQYWFDDDDDDDDDDDVDVLFHFS